MIDTVQGVQMMPERINSQHTAVPVSGGVLTPKIGIGSNIPQKSRVKPVTVDTMRTAISQTKQPYKPNVPRGSFNKTLKSMVVGTTYAVCRIAGYGLVSLGCLFMIPKLAATNLISRCFPGLHMVGTMHFWSSLLGLFGLASYITLETTDAVVSAPNRLWFKPRGQEASRRELLEVIKDLEEMAREQQARLDEINIGKTIGRRVTERYQYHLKRNVSSGGEVL